MASDLYDEFVTPAELTGYAREALDERPENEFALSVWLPDDGVDDLRYRLEQGPEGLLDVADYRSWNAEPTFGRRESIKAIEGSLPPLGRQMTLTEYDALIMRNAEQKARDLLLRDSEKIAKVIGRRMEVARADAIVNASVTIEENGLRLSVDFERSTDLEVTAETTWDNFDDVDLLDEWLRWRDVYRDINGRLPGACLTSERVVRAMLRNAQVREAITVNPGDRVRRSNLDDLLSDEGLPPIYTYEARKTLAGPDGVRRTSRMIPSHKLIMLPEPGPPSGTQGDLGTSLWGSTIESQLPEYGIEPGEEPGIVVAAFIERRTPVRVDTIGSAIGLPVLAAPNLSMVADVLPPVTD